VRFALDLHRAKRGSYPERLEMLVDAGWLHAKQCGYGGLGFDYAVSPDGGSYTLAFVER
jgi:hypothetical protein